MTMATYVQRVHHGFNETVVLPPGWRMAGVTEPHEYRQDARDVAVFSFLFDPTVPRTIRLLLCLSKPSEFLHVEPANVLFCQSVVLNSNSSYRDLFFALVLRQVSVDDLARSDMLPGSRVLLPRSSDESV